MINQEEARKNFYPSPRPAGTSTSGKSSSSSTDHGYSDSLNAAQLQKQGEVPLPRSQGRQQ